MEASTARIHIPAPLQDKVPWRDQHINIRGNQVPTDHSAGIGVRQALRLALFVAQDMPLIRKRGEQQVTRYRWGSNCV
jgi:hypothetical protein